MPHPQQMPVGDPQAAVKAAASQPQSQVAALFEQGLALHQQAQLAQAQQIYEQVLAKQPTHFDALHLSGVIAAQSKNPTLAVALIGKAIEVNPNNAAAYSNRGIALKELNRMEEALASHDRAIAIKPDYADAHSNRGIALQELKRVEEALASYDRAIAIEPDYADAYYNRGIALQELKRVEEALASYDRAIAIKPDFADAHYNRGNALKELKRVEEAIASHDRAIAINPDHANAYWNKSLALLVAGQFAQGWELYEWRWKRDTFTSPNRNFSQPLWMGAEDIAGKTILLHAEQGLGDTIQFCRYAKLVKERGAHVVLEVPKPLLGLLAGLEGVDELIEKGKEEGKEVGKEGKASPAFDYQCPLLSLPLAFKTDLTNIPSPKPYLAAAPHKREEWAQRLGVKGKPRVGLVWSGSTSHKNDHNRSLTLHQLLPYLPDCCEYVNRKRKCVKWMCRCLRAVALGTMNSSYRTLRTRQRFAS